MSMVLARFQASELIGKNKILDIGCGSKKTVGSTGLDIHPYPGVDVVWNLETFPWPMEDNSFDAAVCIHVIEHIRDFAGFMKEIHRVMKHGSTIYFETPHFSSITSWSDPTHVGHFSTRWSENFQQGSYLAAQCGVFETVQSGVTFGKSLFNLVGKFWVAFRGLAKWEKSMAFMCPAADVITRLKVIKT